MNVGSRQIPGSVLASALLLLCAFFSAPAPEAKWDDLAGIRVTSGSLAGVLVLSIFGSTSSLLSRASQLALLCIALLGTLDLVHLESVSGSAQPRSSSHAAMTTSAAGMSARACNEQNKWPTQPNHGRGVVDARNTPHECSPPRS